MTTGARAGSPPASGRRCALPLLATYLLAVVALAWPLPRYAATHIAATAAHFHLFDTLQVAWANAHETRALATAPTSFLDAGIYHPSRRTLFYGATSLGLLPYFAPTFLATGNPALALNVAFLVCVAATAWSIHLVVHRWTTDHVAGAVAAWTFLMSRTSIWGFVSIAPLYAPLAYLPVLIHAAAMPALGGVAPWVVTALVVLQCACDPLYVAPAVVGPLAAIGVWKLRAATTRADGLALLRALAIAGVLLLPIYAAYADVAMRNPGLSSQSVWPVSEPPAGAPGGLGLLVRVLKWWNLFTVPPLAIALIAAGRSRVRRDATLAPAWRHCALWVAAGVLLPLAKTVAPILRAAHRGGLVSLVAIALLAGLAFAAIARGRPAWARIAAGMALSGVLFALPEVPGQPSVAESFLAYPLQPAPRRDAPIAAALALRRGPVLELPAGAPAADAIAQYLAIFHGRPVLNGYGSYFPVDMPARLALVRRLPDAAIYPLLRAATGLETIVVDARRLPPKSRRAWEGALRGGPYRRGLRLVGHGNDVYVFDLEDTSSDPAVSAGRGTAADASRRTRSVPPAPPASRNRARAPRSPAR